MCRAHRAQVGGAIAVPVHTPAQRASNGNRTAPPSLHIRHEELLYIVYIYIYIRYIYMWALPVYNNQVYTCAKGRSRALRHERAATGRAARIIHKLFTLGDNWELIHHEFDRCGEALWARWRLVRRPRFGWRRNGSSRAISARHTWPQSRK